MNHNSKNHFRSYSLESPNTSQNSNNNNKNNILKNTVPTFMYESFRKELHIQLTKEEDILYNKLFNTLDKNNKGIISSSIAADFMRKFGLDIHILKKIWDISAQTSRNNLNKEEFFIALRLIALAQNNMSYSAENIEKNWPIPPLPKLKKNKNTSMNIINNKQDNNDNIHLSNNLIYENEINELKKKLKEEKDKNALLIKENNKLKEKIEKLNGEIELNNKLKNKIKILEDNLNRKNNEIQNFISLNNNKDDNYTIKSILPGEKILAVNFVSMGLQDVGHYMLIYL